MIYLGIDPGKSGGIGWLNDSSDCPQHVAAEVGSLKVDGMTEADLADWLEGVVEYQPKAVIERVSSSPQMGVASAFTFGRSFGFWLGVLAGLGIPYGMVTPQKWQKAMGCLTKGDKNVSKAAAQRLYPKEKITHATADALLLATYCRRHASELF